jgi:hypothetical protein
MPTIDEKKVPETGDLRPYYFRGPNQPVLYNGIQVVQQGSGPVNQTVYNPPLSANTFKVPDIPERLVVSF